ncbi:MAG TPA: SBBP repeat-containing protein [Chitinophagaceae bacterium]|nr:SBBP repeat-containing protein [Chitinophagaceae bacterium]
MRIILLILTNTLIYHIAFSQNPSLSFAHNPSGSSYERVGSGTVDQQNNIYLSGAFTGTIDIDPTPVANVLTANAVDAFITKSNNAGNLTWANQLKGANTSSFSDVWSIGVDLSGNVYAMGQFKGTVDFDPGTAVNNMTSTNVSSYDMFIVKLNAAGVFQWSKQIADFAINQKISTIPIDGMGNIYVYGCFMGTVDFDPGPGVYTMTSSTTSRDPFILKVNSSGNFVWAKQIDDPGEGIVFSTKLDAADNIYLTGYFSGSADFDPGPSTTLIDSTNGAAYILKLNNAGDFLWVKQFGAGGYFTSSSNLNFDTNGNIYCTGSFQGVADLDPGPGVQNLTSSGLRDAFVLKLSPVGDFQWAKKLGGANSDGGDAIAIDAIGNILVSGSFEGAADFDPGPDVFQITALGIYDIFVVALDANGKFRNAFKLGNTDFDHPISINIDTQNSLIITGNFFLSIDADPCENTMTLSATASQDFFYIKYNQPITIQITISTPGTTIISGQSVTASSSITNGGTSPGYQWQDSTALHTWQNIPGATSSALNYAPLQTGDKLRCLLTSNAPCATGYSFTSNVLQFTVNAVTAINPTSGNAYNIKLFPNPVSEVIYIDSLKLSDHWETAEILTAVGHRYQTISIENKTKAVLSVHQLPPGQYIILLRRKNHASYLKFIKI